MFDSDKRHGFLRFQGVVCMSSQIRANMGASAKGVKSLRNTVYFDGKYVELPSA